MSANPKTVFRVVILSLSVLSLALLASPTSVNAFTCTQAYCHHVLLVCDAACGNNSNCQANCYDQYLACLGGACDLP